MILMIYCAKVLRVVWLIAPTYKVGLIEKHRQGATYKIGHPVSFVPVFKYFWDYLQDEPVPR